MMKCRSCFEQLELSWADLRTSPPSNSFLSQQDLAKPEVYYPLEVKVCQNCWLAQIDEYKHHAEIFSKNYVYFSSFSKSWLAHAKSYVAQMILDFPPQKDFLWIEIASNDGYLLQYVKAVGLPALGIEPTESTAAVSRQNGILTISEFFGCSLGKSLAEKGHRADLMTANNVLAHVPNLHDFLGGFCEILKPEGVVTFEFPHLLNLLELNQFDTIYHEHFSYLSLTPLVPLFEKIGLKIFRVQEIPTHGGSLRVFAGLKSSQKKIESSVDQILQKEDTHGLRKPEIYKMFQLKIDQVKNDLLNWLVSEKRQGRRVAAYGAAAKGNTLFNYAGVGRDLICAVADASPYKQNLYLPGSRIPVVSPDQLQKLNPDSILILPWNIREEIADQLRPFLKPQVQMVVAIPKLEIFK